MESVDSLGVSRCVVSSFVLLPLLLSSPGRFQGLTRQVPAAYLKVRLPLLVPFWCIKISVGFWNPQISLKNKQYASKTHKNTDFSIWTCPTKSGTAFFWGKNAPAAISKVGKTKYFTKKYKTHRFLNLDMSKKYGTAYCWGKNGACGNTQSRNKA